jgi:hypothetical protein
VRRNRSNTDSLPHIEVIDLDRRFSFVTAKFVGVYCGVRPWLWTTPFRASQIGYIDE